MRTSRPFVSVTVSRLAALLSLSAPSHARPISLDEAERTVARKSIEVNVKLPPLTEKLIAVINFEEADMQEFYARQVSVHTLLTEMGFQHAWSDQYYDVNYVAWYSAERDMTVICNISYGQTSQHWAHQQKGKVGRHDHLLW